MTDWTSLASLLTWNELLAHVYAVFYVIITYKVYHARFHPRPQCVNSASRRTTSPDHQCRTIVVLLWRNVVGKRVSDADDISVRPYVTPLPI